MSKKKNEENAGADEQLQEEKAEPETVKEFKISKGVNVYGFVFIPKKARSSLPFEQGVPLKARIEGETLILREEYLP